MESITTAVAQAVSFARLRQKIRSVGHRFHAARNDHGTVSRLHRLRRESHCFQSGAANLVDCHGTCRGRQSAEDCGLPRGILSESGGDDVAHDALVNLIGTSRSGALHRFAHHDSTQLRRAQIGETSLKFSYRRTAAGNNDNIVKRGHESSSREDFAPSL
jgi:hypothetical protein